MSVINPHAQHEGGKVIGVGVHIYMCVYMCVLTKKFEKHFRDFSSNFLTNSTTACSRIAFVLE